MGSRTGSTEPPLGGSDGTPMACNNMADREAVMGNGTKPLAVLEVSVGSDSSETLSAEEDFACAPVQEEDVPEEENGICIDSECVVKQEDESRLSESADGLVDGSGCDSDESGIEESRCGRKRTRPLNDPRSSRTCKQRRSSSEQRHLSELQRNKNEVSAKTEKEERIELKVEDSYETDEYELLAKERSFETKVRLVGRVVGSIIVYERKTISAEQDDFSEPQWSKQEDCGRMEKEEKMEIKEEDHSEDEEYDPKVNENSCETKGGLVARDLGHRIVYKLKTSTKPEDLSATQRNKQEDCEGIKREDKLEIKDGDNILSEEYNPKPKESSCDSKEGLVESDVESTSVSKQRGTAEQLCPDCGVIYTTRTHKCGTEKLFPCPRCSRRFTSELSLTVHGLNCKGPVVYKCRFCLSPFKVYKDKVRHQDYNCLAAVERNPYLCSECPQRFPDIVIRNRHLRQHPSKRFICQTCHKEFNKRQPLTRHEFSHSNEKPFKCKVCGRAFAQDGHLKSHMRVHTGERPYQCTFCQMSFNHNISLKNHISRYHHSTGQLIQHSDSNATKKPERSAKPQPKDPSDARRAKTSRRQGGDTRCKKSVSL